MPAHLVFDESTWTKLLDLISDGHSLSEITRMPSMPSLAWCRKGLAADAELRRAYHHACECRADLLGDAIVQLADEEIPIGLDPAERSAWVQRQRLRVDSRKWVAAKLKPRVWGDRVAVDAPAITVDIKLLLAQREERLLHCHTLEDAETLPIART